MPEPVTIILVGGAVYAFLKGRTASPKAVATLPGAPGTETQVLAGPARADAAGQPLSTGAAGTGPTAPLATPTSIVNGVSLAAVAADPLTPVKPIPDLAHVLEDDTALQMRRYVALHPDDFQGFLNRYADYIVLRQDLFIEAIAPPPPAGFQPTPTMVATLGVAAYKVAQGLNGVAAGRYGDIFGVASTAAGNIPGLNQDFVSAVQGLSLGYRAFTAISAAADIATIAAANGVSIMNVTGTMLETGGAVESLGLGAGAGSLAGAPIQTFSGVLMAVGLCVDIGFTIIGNKPDLQKAIDVALDVASLVCLFIPVIGWVIAIVIQLVKFIIDCFGEELFGGGLSHRERELIEAAHYGELLGPMFPKLANAYTPRELFSVIVEWGSGYCGGAHDVAMMVALNLRVGDQIMVGGQVYTVPADTTLTVGRQPCYWFVGTPFAAMTNEEQAWALGKYAATNGVVARAQVGVTDALKEQFENPAEQLIAARAAPMKTFIEHGVTLDGIDLIVAEYRAQPGLNALATFYGFTNWQAMLGQVLADEWVRWASNVTHGALSDFARENGYPTMYAYRAAAFKPFQDLYDKAKGLGARMDAIEHFWSGFAPLNPLAGTQDPFL